MDEAALDRILNSIDYRNRPYIKQQLLEASSRYHQLQFKKAEFVHNDGRCSQLCMLSGTLPMTHTGVVYNIPIDVFIVEAFPDEPPKVYVRPTADMIVSPNHLFVEPDGSVNITKFISGQTRTTAGRWSRNYRLADFLCHLSAKFGDMSPLFTRPRQTVQQTQQYHQQIQHRQYQAQLGADPIVATAVSRSYTPNAVATATYASGGTGYVSHLQPQTTPAQQMPGNNNTANLKNQLTDMLRLRIGKDISRVSSELTSRFKASKDLRENKQRITDIKKFYNDMKEKLNKGIKEVEDKQSKLNKLISDKAREGIIEPEDRLLCTDELSKQLVDLEASDRAHDDCIYQLDKAAQATNHAGEPMFKISALLKNTANIAEKQFYARARYNKIKEKLVNEGYRKEDLEYWLQREDF